jgi:hypothetical protein
MTLVPPAVLARALYLYENDSINPVTAGVGSNARDLYAYENDGVQVQSVPARGLYAYEATYDLPVVPWIDHIDPVQQYPSGQVQIFGDGLGQFDEVGAGATITASSTNGSNIPANVTHRNSDYWQSNDASPWLRFTFSGSTTLYGIALSDLVDAATNVWGTPLFRFSSGADVIGASAVPIPTTSYRPAEYPVGMVRTLYVFPAERTVSWVEVRVSSGGAGAARGLSQVWIYADDGKTAEPSTVSLNGETSGVSGPWLNRSPGLWPANSGIPLTAAGTMTVPADGTSGLVKVSEP